VFVRAVRKDKAVAWVEVRPVINCVCGTKAMGG
jgi:hypothetical protein